MTVQNKMLCRIAVYKSKVQNLPIFLPIERFVFIVDIGYLASPVIIKCCCPAGAPNTQVPKHGAPT